MVNGGRLAWLLRRPVTLADGLAAPQDNFLLLRMVAACLVIYGHARALTGGTRVPDFIQYLGWGAFSGGLAVWLFFITSGFLVTGSYQRRPDPWRFAVARLFRIVPAFAVCIALTALVLGAVETTLPLRQYYADPATWSYLSHNIQFGELQQSLPGVFLDNPSGDYVNGSLWTLAAEVRMYLYVLVVGLLGLLRRRWLANAAVCTLLLLGCHLGTAMPGLAQQAWAPLAAMFGVGALAWINRDVVPASFRVLLVCALAASLLRPTALYYPALGIALAAFVFWFAYRIPWHGYNALGDYSYGTYLYGFAVQQTLAQHLPMLHSLVHTAIALPIAIALGVASWTFIEKPSIALGKRIGRRRAGQSRQAPGY